MATLIQMKSTPSAQTESKDATKAIDFLSKKLFKNKFQTNIHKLNSSHSLSNSSTSTYFKQYNKKTSQIKFNYKMILNGEKNQFFIRCFGLSQEKLVFPKTKEVKSMLLYNMAKINHFHGAYSCQVFLNQKTGLIYGKSLTLINYDTIIKRYQSLYEIINFMQYQLRKMLSLVYKVINQFPDNLPLKIQNIDKRQTQINQRITNYLHTSIIEQLDQRKPENNTYQESYQKLKDKLLLEQSPQIQRNVSKIFQLNLSQNCKKLVSLQMSEIELEKKKTYLAIPLPKKKQEKQYIFNQIYINNAQKVQVKLSKFRGGGSKIYITKINFFYSHLLKERDPQIKSQTKILAMKAPLEDHHQYQKKISHQISIVKKFSETHSKLFLKYYTAPQEDFNFRECLLMDLQMNIQPLDILLKRKNISLFLKLFILINILQTIRLLSQKGVVHMDLSLRNVLIDEKLRIKLIDFGESYHQDLCRQDYCPGYTIPFAFPERFNNKYEFSTQSDFFSYAIIIFYTIFKRYPFSRTYHHQNALKNKTYFKQLVIIPEISSYIGYENMVFMILAYINKCLHPDPQKRPQPASSLIFLKDVFYWLQDMLQMFIEN